MRTETKTNEQTPRDKASLFSDIASLGALREELRLQAHLFQAEARTRFEMLEKSWHEIERVTRALEEESTEAAQRLGHAAAEMVDELKTQYRRLKSEVSARE